MKTDRLIVIITAIAFSAVSSGASSLQGEDGAVCYVTVNKTRTVHTGSDRMCSDLPQGFARSYRKNCNSFHRDEVSWSSRIEPRCCEGYEDINSICLPRCSPNCLNGYCIKPNECRCNDGWTGKICDQIISQQRQQTNDQDRRCGEGYEKIFSFCVPRCSPDCENGRCTKPNECSCIVGWYGSICDQMVSRVPPTRSSVVIPTDEPRTDASSDSEKQKIGMTDSETPPPDQYIKNDTKPMLQDTTDSMQKNDSVCGHGWRGKACSESLFCVIVESTEVNITERESYYRRIEVETKTEAIFKGQNRPECLPACLASLAVHITHYGNKTYHFIPIESPCNVEVGTFKYQIIGSLGIVLLAIIVVCIVFVVRRQRRPGTTENEKPVETDYEYVCGSRRLPDKPTMCEYDYVYGHRQIQEEPSKLEYDYVYNHRL